MSIWTFRHGLRRGIAATCLALGLAACAQEDGGFAFLDLGGQNDDPDTRANVSLATAQMMRGAVTLVPPSGYCVDKRGLKQNFAVIAQCTSLGGESGPDFAPLGLILVAVAPAQGEIDLAATLTAMEGLAAQTLDVQNRPGLALRQLRGDTPAGTNPEYWRGVTRTGAHIISMTAYAPEGGSLSGSYGATVLTELAQRTRAATPPVTGADQPNARDDQDATEPRKGLRGLVSGLFD